MEFYTVEQYLETAKSLSNRQLLKEHREIIKHQIELEDASRKGWVTYLGVPLIPTVMDTTRHMLAVCRVLRMRGYEPSRLKVRL